MLAYGMHRHTITKFGSKRFSSSGDSFWTNINWNFEPLLWPRHWTQEANIFTRYSDLYLPSALTCIYHQAIFGCKIIFSSEGIIILLYFSTCHDFVLKGSISVFSHYSLCLIWCNTKLSLLTKGQAMQKRTSRQSLNTWRDKWTGGHANSYIPSSHTPYSVKAGAEEFCWYTADELCLYSKRHCSWSVSIKMHIHCGWSLFLTRNKYTVTYVCLHPETTAQKSPTGSKKEKKDRYNILARA